MTKRFQPPKPPELPHDFSSLCAIFPQELYRLHDGDMESPFGVGSLGSRTAEGWNAEKGIEGSERVFSTFFRIPSCLE
jgi:hypothetical protein